MANKQLFASPRPDAVNEAGGLAYAFSPEHALAQYAATGTFHGTFYASDKEQLDRVSAFASACSPELVAKTAVYCRERGRMKDMPAFLVAHLAARDTAMMSRVFARVIDDGVMLRNFVQIVRSGVTGRKSFGSAPKRALRAWFASRSPDAIFRQSIGQSPSMSDVIKMVRPPPRNDKGEADAVREALYGYLIGKNVDPDKLPALARAFEAWKRRTGGLPDVPFEMLTSLPLSAEDWKALARRMTTNQLRINLNTLLRHGVLDDPEMVDSVAARLSDREAILRARMMPFQLLAAYRGVEARMPTRIVTAIATALEHAVSNVPELVGRVVLCPDVSGSMQSPVTGHRGSATTKVRCVDVAALVTAAILRKNPGSSVIPFSDDVVPMTKPLDPGGSIVENAEILASLPSGGTACSAPLRWLNANGNAPDVVVFVSDNQSWSDFRHPSRSATSGTAMAEEWQRLRGRNPNAKLILVDVQPYGTTQSTSRDAKGERDDVLDVGGFSDAVFDVVASFTRGELGGDTWLRAIESIAL
ncbi:MAG: TROVE domain-containing protein [Labilithrix sp.]|nr:TROVE domain-containing protein [Labilithrix sp.]